MAAEKVFCNTGSFLQLMEGLTAQHGISVMQLFTVSDKHSSLFLPLPAKKTHRVNCCKSFFITFGPGVNFTKHFFFFLLTATNKLQRS